MKCARDSFGKNHESCTDHHFQTFPFFETFVLPVKDKGWQGFAASLTDAVQVGNFSSPDELIHKILNQIHKFITLK